MITFDDFDIPMGEVEKPTARTLNLQVPTSIVPCNAHESLAVSAGLAKRQD